MVITTILMIFRTIHKAGCVRDYLCPICDVPDLKFYWASLLGDAVILLGVIVFAREFG